MKSLIIAYPGQSNLLEEVTAREEAHVVILHATNLHTFAATFQLHPLTLSILASTVSFTLWQLEVCLNGGVFPALYHVNGFPDLAVLRVTFLTLLGPTLSSLNPWKLLFVRALQFVWSNGAGIPSAEMLSFLASCRFSPRCRIELNIAPLPQVRSAILNTFLEAH